MARLPIVGEEDWGDVLNEFLSVSLAGDGVLKPSTVQLDNLSASNSPAVNQLLTNNGTDLAWATMAMPTYRDGTTSATTVERPTFYDVRDYGATLGSTNNSPAFQAAIDAASSAGGGIVFIPGGRWTIAATIRLKDYVTVMGVSGLQINGAGTVLYWTSQDTAIPAFDSDPGNFLSSATVRDLGLYTPLGSTPAYLADADAFHLYGATNSCRFERVYVARFRGNAFTFDRQTLNTGDHTGAGNVTFNQVFISRVAGWGFDIDGYTIATWTLPDVNTPGKGAFRFRGGISNQMSPVIVNGWFEGGCYAGAEEILVENSNGRMPLTLIGCTFQNVGNVAQDTVIRATGAGGVVASLTNCVGYGYTYWVKDAVTGKDMNFSTQISYEGGGISADLAAITSSDPRIEMIDTDGTANQRRFRLTFGGNELQIQARNDAAALTQVPLKLRHTDSRATFGGLVIWATDNTSDIGASGASRPRDLFLGRNATIGGALDHDGSTVGFYGAALVAKATVAAAATDAATTQALANDLRSKLIALGLVS